MCPWLRTAPFASQSVPVRQEGRGVSLPDPPSLPASGDTHIWAFPLSCWEDHWLLQKDPWVQSHPHLPARREQVPDGSGLCSALPPPAARSKLACSGTEPRAERGTEGVPGSSLSPQRPGPPHREPARQPSLPVQGLTASDGTSRRCFTWLSPSSSLACAYRFSRSRRTAVPAPSTFRPGFSLALAVLFGSHLRELFSACLSLLKGTA